MSRPLRPLRNAISNITESSKSRQRQLSREATPYVLLHEIPRTATADDVLRALKQTNLVGLDFDLSAITSPPPTSLRQPTITKTYHITLPTPSSAQNLQRQVSNYPLFPTTSRKVIAQPPVRPRTASSPEYTPGPASVGATVAERTIYRPHDWISSLLARAGAGVRRGGLSNEGGHDGPDGSGSGGAHNFGRRSRRGSDPDEGDGILLEHRRGQSDRNGGDPIGAKWVMEPSAMGRRVLLRGLPANMASSTLAKITAECGVKPREEPIKKLIPTPGSMRSTFVVTADSVANAYRLARKFNMNYYRASENGERFLMRAEVLR